MLAASAQVPAEEIAHRVHPRAGYVGRQPGRGAERQFHEPGCDLTGVDRLEPEAGWLDEGVNDRRLGLGRSIAFLTAAHAAAFISELEALVERFDDAHAAGDERRPYALVWALYPSSRRIR